MSRSPLYPSTTSHTLYNYRFLPSTVLVRCKRRHHLWEYHLVASLTAVVVHSWSRSRRMFEHSLAQECRSRRQLLLPDRNYQPTRRYSPGPVRVFRSPKYTTQPIPLGAMDRVSPATSIVVGSNVLPGGGPLSVAMPIRSSLSVA